MNSVDKRGGDTPLHYTCSNSQDSRLVAKLLIDHGPEAVNIKNTNGELPIHVACCARASTDVLRHLINANPQSLLVEDRIRGEIPLKLLWMSYSACIHGAQSLSKALKDRKIPQTGHLRRLWERMCLLVCETSNIIRKKRHGEKNFSNLYESNDNLLHAVVSLDTPISGFLQLSLKIVPEQLYIKDMDSNLPLHIATSNSALFSSITSRPWKPAIDQLVCAYSDAARLGPILPLHLALENGCTNTTTIMNLIRAAPEALITRDVKLHLFPFMIAAVASMEKERVSQTEIIFTLLRANPDLLSC